MNYTNKGAAVEYRFDDILSEENYKAILKLNDLSYAKAKKLTVTDAAKRELVDYRDQNLVNELEGMGWAEVKEIKGKTGYNNKDEDITAIITRNREKDLIVVAFHGSRNGSMIPLFNDGGGDWGANHDYEAVGANTVLPAINVPII